MNPLVFSSFDLLWPKKEAATRFNRSFSQAGEDLRSRLGEIKADHAARGLLMSGATIKHGLAAYEKCLEQGLSLNLEYVSAKTAHPGWKRRKMIELLDAMLDRYADSYGVTLEEHCIKIARGGAAAADDAEHLRRKVVSRLHDKVKQFAEGIGLARLEPRVNRHPFLTSAIVTILGILIANLLGFFGLD